MLRRLQVGRWPLTGGPRDGRKARILARRESVAPGPSEAEPQAAFDAVSSRASVPHVGPEDVMHPGWSLVGLACTLLLLVGMLHATNFDRASFPEDEEGMGWAELLFYSPCVLFLAWVFLRELRLSGASLPGLRAPEAATRRLHETRSRPPASHLARRGTLR